MYEHSIIKRWAKVLRRSTELNASQARTAAEGYMSWYGGGTGCQHERRLLQDVAGLLEYGFSPAETARWMAGGFDGPAADAHRAFGISAAQAQQMNMAQYDEDSPLWMADNFWPYIRRGVPSDLICLILDAGCVSLEEFNDYIARWAGGEQIQPALRLLVALSSLE